MRNEAHMNYLRRKTADEAELWAADRIEKLEREFERIKEDCAQACLLVAKMHAAAVGAMIGPKRGVVEDIEDLRLERDTLQADNARLREALIGYHSVASGVLGVPSIAECAKKASSALATTPEQSLARVRNQVREECAVELDGHWDMAAGIIRAMKE